MTEVIEIHVTCPSLLDAREIAHRLLDDRLAACCNMPIKEMDSRFHWKGKQERQDEWLLTAKTRADLFDAAAAAIREIHPYETPAIFGFKVDLVDAATAAWVDESCRPA
ncbi:divalent-cation tolerance protein CutA [Jiella sp. MQZ9-1]|uniref:Divalent-cation tolerance protein CutA n=1 Tax=Jiella flava TaxID=2816857 RepID=A0A939JUY0_9HYPH|nr:divalent-cation tolerance protein CutA [Jiella flava]MBO0661432.1 divalent-cation tolerance protein CutA [Jiella flava]MCD2470075.1 divalent-cation tolerance protein CutA [Jiella flava]